MPRSNLRFKQCHESQEGLETKTPPSTCRCSNLNYATTTTSFRILSNSLFTICQPLNTLWATDSVDK